MQYTKHILMSGWLISTAHFANAGEAYLAITTEPREADIFIDGVLKANTTPTGLKVPEGTHQLQVKKLGYQVQEMEVLLVKDAVVSKKVQLTPLVSTNAEWLTPEELLTPKRNQFETEAEFAARQQLPFSETVKRFNAAVNQHNVLYQAGTAQFANDSYDLNTQKFKLKITPQAWAERFSSLAAAFIVIPKNQARALWQEGMEKPVFVTLKLATATPELGQLFMVGVEKHWPIQQEQLISGRYLDNGDGTITDVQTHLMWKRCSEGQEWNGTTCTGEANKMTWDDAMPNAQQKAWSTFAGYSDWRVLAKAEFLILRDCSRNKTARDNFEVWLCKFQTPTIDAAFPNPNNPNWTSSPYAANSSKSWLVMFSADIVLVSNDYRSNSYAVRLVRWSK